MHQSFEKWFNSGLTTGTYLVLPFPPSNPRWAVTAHPPYKRTRLAIRVLHRSPLPHFIFLHSLRHSRRCSSSPHSFQPSPSLLPRRPQAPLRRAASSSSSHRKSHNLLRATTGQAAPSRPWSGTQTRSPQKLMAIPARSSLALITEPALRICLVSSSHPTVLHRGGDPKYLSFACTCNLHTATPLASGFLLTSGNTTVTVPCVTPGDTYFVVRKCALSCHSCLPR
jgi:hypothetical protein